MKHIVVSESEGNSGNSKSLFIDVRINCGINHKFVKADIFYDDKKYRIFYKRKSKVTNDEIELLKIYKNLKQDNNILKILDNKDIVGVPNGKIIFYNGMYSKCLYEKIHEIFNSNVETA